MFVADAAVLVTDNGRSSVIFISVNRGNTTSRPRRDTIKTPETQVETIRATPAVETSVALDTIVSMINCVASSASLARPAVTPMLIAIHAFPGRSPRSWPSPSIFVCDLRSNSAPVRDAVIGIRFPPGSVNPVNVRYSDPARLPQRGGVFRTTLPATIVPAGRTTCEFNKTGSSKRACTKSPGLLFDALTSPRRRILHVVPAGRISWPDKSRAGEDLLSAIGEDLRRKEPPAPPSAPPAL